jgi:hypothetical protein
MSDKEQEASPEFSRRAARALLSPYFAREPEDTTDKEAVISFYERQDAKLEWFREALEAAADYDALPDDVRRVFDEAEKAGEAYDAEMDSYGGRLNSTREAVSTSQRAVTMRHASPDVQDLLVRAMIQAKAQGADEETLQRIAELATKPEKLAKIFGQTPVGIRPPPKEEGKKSLSRDAEVALRVIRVATRMPHRTASLAAVRKALSVAGYHKRQRQDAIIDELRREMKVGLLPLSGQKHLTSEERSAAISEGGVLLGHLVLR